MNELKSRLNEFIRQYSITKFEAEDIIELVSEGESVDWIAGQLKGAFAKEKVAASVAELEHERSVIAELLG